MNILSIPEDGNWIEGTRYDQVRSLWWAARVHYLGSQNYWNILRIRMLRKLYRQMDDKEISSTVRLQFTKTWLLHAFIDCKTLVQDLLVDSKYYSFRLHSCTPVSFNQTSCIHSSYKSILRKHVSLCYYRIWRFPQNRLEWNGGLESACLWLPKQAPDSE